MSFLLGKIICQRVGSYSRFGESHRTFQRSWSIAPCLLYLIGTKGEPAFLYNIGVEYDSGKGVPVNHAKAVQYYLKAAEAGHVLAQYQMGTIYESGAGAEKIMQWLINGMKSSNARAY